MLTRSNAHPARPRGRRTYHRSRVRTVTGLVAALIIFGVLVSGLGIGAMSRVDQTSGSNQSRGTRRANAQAKRPGGRRAKAQSANPENPDSVGSPAGPVLATADFNLIGLAVTASPASQTVPINTATVVNTSVEAPAGTDPSTIISQLNPNYRVMGELSGPSFSSPQELTAAIGQPLQIPALTVGGDHIVQNLRVVDTGTTGNPVIAPVTPDSVGISVIQQLLVSQVQVSQLTYNQIAQSGINVTDDSYQFFNFVLGLGTTSNVQQLSIPVALPTGGSAPNSVPIVGRPSATGAQGIQVPAPNISVMPVMLTIPSQDGAAQVAPTLGGGAPIQIPGAIIIPGNVGFLNSFFQAIVVVSNNAPNGTPLVVSGLTASVTLPNDGTSTPPLAIAPTQIGGVVTTLPIVGLGADGVYGTSDDTTSFSPGQSGQAQFLLEGLKEGLYSLNFNLAGTLNGLPGGPVTIQGQVPGTVLVRDNSFSVTFMHPGTVRAGQTYDLAMTLNNTGSQDILGAVANLTANQISGAELQPGDSGSRSFATTIPVQNSSTVVWHLTSETTGQVTASYVKVGADISAGLILTTGVGDRNVPLSPDSLVLPEQVSFLPPPVVTGAEELLGQAWSVATAPPGGLPAGVTPMSTQTVADRAAELGTAGLRVEFGELVQVSLDTLIRDWLGELQAVPDPGFADTIRNTTAGYDFYDSVGSQLALAVNSETDTAFHHEFASVESPRSPFISALVTQASGPALFSAQFTDPSGNTVGENTSPDDRSGDLPNAASMRLNTGGILGGTSSTLGQMLIVSQPASGKWTLTLTGLATGSADISILTPIGARSYNQIVFAGAQIAVGSVYKLVFQPNSLNVPTLQINQGSGFQSSSATPTVTVVNQPAPTIEGVVQVSDLILDGGDKYGRLVGVLFSEPMAENSAEKIANYSISGGALIGSNPPAQVGSQINVVGANLQLGGRFAFVALDAPIGPFIQRSLTITGLTELYGIGVTPTPATISPTITVSPQGLPPGGYLTGQVLEADGTPIVGAAVQYYEQPCTLIDDPLVVTTQVTDSQGRYAVDYVRNGDCGGPSVATTDPSSGAFKTLGTPIVYNGQHLQFSIVFLAHGNVQGVVTSGGAPAPYAVVSVSSSLDGDRITVQADANGNYSVANVTVGDVSVSARGVGSQVSQTGLAVGNIAGAAQTATVNVDMQTTPGVVTGSVVNADKSPSVGSLVVAKGVLAGSQTQAAIVGFSYTDRNGNFSISNLPLGSITLALTDYVTGLVINQNVQLTSAAPEVDGVVIVLPGYGGVSGTVLNDAGGFISNAIVAAEGSAVQADALGNYAFSNLAAQTTTISAVDPTTLAGGGTTVTVLAGQTVTNANIIISRPAALSGHIYTLDSSGNNVPLNNATVTLDGLTKVQTDPTGSYSISPAPTGTYTLRVVHPNNQLAVNSPITLLAGENLVRDIVFPAPASVHGKVFQPDGVTGCVAQITAFFQRPSLLSNSDFGLLGIDPDNPLQTQSAADGSYSITNMNPGTFSLLTSNVFFPTVVVAGGNLIPGDSQTVNLTLVNTLAGQIQGNVFQPDGATPVGAGVTVTLGGGTLANITVKTDATGHYAFPQVFPANNYSLTATDPTTGLTNQTHIAVAVNQDCVTNITLLGLGNLNISIVDASGNPATGASITLDGNSYPNTHQFTTLDSQTSSFEFTNLPQGTYSVSAAMSEFAGRVSVTVPNGGTVSATIQFQPSGTVTGVVLLPGGTTPEPLADVHLLQNGQQIGFTISDGQTGVFTFTGVPQGDFQLQALDNQTGRIGSAAGTITTQGQTVTTNIILIAQGAVAGQVLSAGAPVSHATVYIAAQGVSLAATTDSQGNYRFPGIPVGTFRLSAISGDLSGSASGQVVGTQEPLPDVIVNITLNASATVIGTVFDSDGVTPVLGATVNLLVGGASFLQTVSGSQGYSFAGVPFGNITIIATSPAGFSFGQASAPVTQPGTATINVTLAGDGTIVGTAVDNLGNPLSIGTVTVTTNPVGSTVVLSTPVQTNGAYQISGVPAGNFTITLTTPEIIGAGSATGTLAANQSLTVPLMLADAGSITGTVVNSAAAPIIGAQVTLTLTPASGSGSGSGGSPLTLITHTNSQGGFQFNNVPLGTGSILIADLNGGNFAKQSGLALTTNGQTLNLGTITAAPNQAPQVSAGPNQTTALPNATVNLQGTVTDDGFPSGAINIGWSEVSGPGPVTFGNPTGAVTTATFTVAGTYVLQLEADDTQLRSASTVTVTVTAAAQTPVVNAGPNQTIILPNMTAQLNGTVTDAVLPPGGTLTSLWSLVSGPGSVTFANAAQPQTTAAFSAPGTYVLQLTANNTQLTSSATVTISIVQALVINTGGDQTVVVSSDLLQNAGAEAALVNDQIPSWAQVTGSTWTQATDTGTAEFPAPMEGKTYFYAGPTASAELSQDVDVSGFASTIAAGTQQFEFKGYVQSAVKEAPDTAEIIVEYRDQANTQVLGSFDSGQIASTLAWEYVTDTRQAPAGTAIVRVRLLAARDSGTDNDAFFDALSLRALPVTGFTAPYTATVNLSGSVTDNALPTGATLATTWSKVSGPGNVTFGNASSQPTTATFDQPGAYVLQLAATDGTNSANSTVNVTADLNEPPVVSAGPDQTLDNPSGSLTLAGTATDDGLPPGSSLSVNWTVISGPGTVTFSNPNAAQTSATFSALGSYVLQLNANDTQLYTSGVTTITVGDTVPPAVVSVSPANRLFQIPVNSVVAVTFSKKLNPSQNFASVLTLSSGPAPGTPVAGTASLDSTGEILTFTPSAPLTQNTFYTVTVQGATDTIGNVQVGVFTSSFWSLDTTPPVVDPLPINGTFPQTTTPTIMATYHDAGPGINPATIVLTLDGVNVTAAGGVTATGLSYTPTSPLSKATHTVTVQVTNFAGLVSALQTATFTIDSTGPVISSFTIGGSPAVNGMTVGTFDPTFAASFTANAGINVSGTQLLLGPQGTSPQLVPAAVTSAGLTYTPPSNLAQGTYSTQLVVADNVGNVTTSALINFTINGTGPVVSTVTPNTGSQDGGTVATITGVRLVNIAGTTPTVTIGGNRAVVTGFTAGSGGSPDQVQISTPAGAPGPATIVVSGDHGTGSDPGAFTYQADPKTPFASEADTLLLWHLNELGNGAVTILDAGPNVINGTADAASLAAPGRFAGGRQFADIIVPGGSDAGVIENATEGPGNFTVECWVKTSPVAESYTLVGGDGGNFGLYLDATGQLNFFLNNQSVGDFQAVSVPRSTYQVDDNQWHYLACVSNVSSQVMSVYIDGVLQASGREALAPSRGSGDLAYAGVGGATPIQFPGILDEIRISGTAHSAQTIQNYFEGTAGPLGLTVVRTSPLTIPRGVSTVIDLTGYNLTLTSAVATDSAAAPIRATILSTQDTAATIQINPSSAAALGMGQLSISSPAGSATLQIDIVDLSRVVLSPQSDTLLLWHLDETANGAVTILDAGPNAINGTADAASVAAPGRFAGARQFADIVVPGGSDEGVIENATEGSGNFTVECWVNTGPVAESYTLVGGDGGNFGLSLDATGQLNFFTNNQSVGLFQEASVPRSTYQVDDNQWHYLVGVSNVSSQIISLYIDGALQSSARGALAPSRGSGDLAYAGVGGGTPIQFPGILDEIRISSTAHSASAISQVYNGDTGLLVTSYSPSLVNRDKSSSAPVTTDIVVNGYGLDSITAAVQQSGQPSSVGVSIVSNSYRQATLAVSVPQTVPLGPLQLVLSSSGQPPVTLNLQVVEQSPLALAPDTLLLWRLDETQNGAVQINDSSPYAINGTADAASLAVPGRFAGGRQLADIVVPGGSDGGVIENATEGSGDFTVECWVNTGPVTQSYTLVGGDGGNFGLYLDATGQLNFFIFNPNTGFQTASVPRSMYRVDNNQWHSVVGVSNVSSQVVSLYIDGVLQGSSRETGAPFPGSGFLAYAGVGAAAPIQFPGILDEIRISSTAHSAAQVSADYFGHDAPVVTFTQPSIVQQGGPSSLFVFNGSSLEGVTITAQQPGVTVANVSPSTDGTKVSLLISAASTVSLGAIDLTVTDQLGQSTAVQLTVVDQEPFNPNDTGTVLLWRLDETQNGAVSILDSGPNSIQATADATSIAVPGRFAGGRQYANIVVPAGSDGGAIENATAPTASFTAECWVNTGTVSKTYNLVAAYGGNFNLYLDGLGLHCFVGNPNGSQDVTVPRGTYQVDDNQWHYLAAVVDEGSQTISLYVDGLLRVSSKMNPLVAGSGFLVNAGGNSTAGATPQFPGTLDEIRIVNFARTAAQISTTWLGPNPSGASLTRPVRSDVANALASVRPATSVRTLPSNRATMEAGQAAPAKAAVLVQVGEKARAVIKALIRAPLPAALSDLVSTSGDGKPESPPHKANSSPPSSSGSSAPAQSGDARSSGKGGQR
jgi:hypothetical protein